MKIRHANLPDTSVLHAYSQCAPELFNKSLTEFNLPKFEFVTDRPEWRRLPSDLFTGESDLVESVNWFPIFWNITRGGSSPRLDWIGPFLQLFVGHCVFLRKDHLKNHLKADLLDFEQFRNKAQTGRDLSLRSLVAWVQQSGDQKNARAKALEAAWIEAIVGCQRGTDYHIAARRVAPILVKLTGGIVKDDPTIAGIDNLNRGYQEFRGGTITGFTGNLLHSASLLADSKPVAFLLAGPADLRVPSLNTLAGRKGLFDSRPQEANSQNGVPNDRVLALWGDAVTWFRDNIVNTESDENIKKFVESFFSDFNMENHTENDELKPLAVFKSLMQTWVKWFKDPEEARAFFGDGGFEGSTAGDVSAEDLVKLKSDEFHNFRSV